MAQYVGNISSSDQIFQNLGNMINQDSQAGQERARVNAANYLRNLRNDAQKAGYSISQWAKLNEGGVKAALYNLSNYDKKLTDQKYQELINGPESGAQKKQRLEDNYIKEKSPDDLFGTDPTYKTETEVIPGKKAHEPIKIPIKDFREKIKTSGVKDILSAGKLIFGEDANLSYKSKTPEAKAYWNWRTKVAKAYGMNNYKGTPEQNKALLKMIQAGNPTQEVQIEGTKGELSKPLEDNLNSIVKDPSSFRPADQKTLDSIKNRLDTDPSYKNGVRQAALEVLKKGGKNPLEGSPFSSWTPELFKSLFKTGTPGGSYKFEGNLPDIDFSFQDTPEKTIEVKKEVDPGKPGYAKFYGDMLNKVYKDSGPLGAPELDQLNMKHKEEVARINNMESGTEKNKALTDLYKTQTMMAKIPPKGVDKNKFEIFTNVLKNFDSQYPAQGISKLRGHQLDAYKVALEHVVNTAKAMGFHVNVDNIHVPTGMLGLGSGATIPILGGISMENYNTQGMDSSALFAKIMDQLKGTNNGQFNSGQ